MAQRRVNRGRLFKLQRIQHDLQAHSYRQDHQPEVTLSPIVPTPFIESWEERLQIRSMQSEEVILSGFTDQFLIEGDGDQLTVVRLGGPGRSKACGSDPSIVSSIMVKMVVRTMALSSICSALLVCL